MQKKEKGRSGGTQQRGGVATVPSGVSIQPWGALKPPGKGGRKGRGTIWTSPGARSYYRDPLAGEGHREGEKKKRGGKKEEMPRMSGKLEFTAICPRLHTTVRALKEGKRERRKGGEGQKTGRPPLTSQPRVTSWRKRRKEGGKTLRCGCGIFPRRRVRSAKKRKGGKQKKGCHSWPPG